MRRRLQEIVISSSGQNVQLLLARKIFSGMTGWQIDCNGSKDGSGHSLVG